MTFTLTDIIILLIILIFAIIGAAKGFIKAIFGKLCWILGILGAIFFYRKLSEHMISLVHNQTVSYIICFIIIFVVIFLIVKIIQIIVEKIFGGEIMQGLDRALGFFFGLLEGFVVVFAGLFVLTIQPWFDISGFLNGSLFYTILLPLIIKSQDSIPAVTAEVALTLSNLSNNFFAG